MKAPLQWSCLNELSQYPLTTTDTIRSSTYFFDPSRWDQSALIGTGGYGTARFNPFSINMEYAVSRLGFDQFD
ncbi:MAG: hypothetical protein ACKOYC_05995, partial [Bacteroidota bacterium]